MWPLVGSFARLVLAVIGGAIAVRLESLPLLYAVIGCSFLAYALVPAIAFKRGAWDRAAGPAL
jgi:ammonia channel protein AmtB